MSCWSKTEFPRFALAIGTVNVSCLDELLLIVGAATIDREWKSSSNLAEARLFGCNGNIDGRPFRGEESGDPTLSEWDAAFLSSTTAVELEDAALAVYENDLRDLAIEGKLQ
jgi:hypothetical protein